MATINLTVYGHEITCTNEEKPVLSQGSHNIDTVIFTYDSTYSGYKLYATMYQSMSDPVLVELSNNSCKIPIDALRYPGKVRIGLRAEDSNGSVIATSCLEWFNVEPGAIDGSEGTSTSGIASLVNRIAALESKTPPDATTATAGQSPIADGAGGWYWGAGGKGIPTSVKQAIVSLLKKAAISPDLETDPSGETPYDVSAEINVIDEWASTRVVGIRLNPNTISFTEGDSVTISAELIPSDADDDILWSSSDDSVAIVAEGVVTPVANGTCKIFATVGNISASCDVTVSGFCTITNNLEYIVNSNTAMGGRVGGTYSGTLTAVKGVLETASVSILMDGTDVTESVYSNGNIVIQNITGDIVINASIPNTTVQIAKDGYIQYLANTTDGDSAYTQVARTYGAITIPYVRTTPNKYINLAGVIPQNGTVLKYNSKGTASIFMYDMNDNFVHNGGDVYPQYVDMSQCGFVQNNADTYTEGTKSLNRTLFHKYTFCVDTRYIDDAYLYDVNGGQIYFAGVNTKYYGMTNISQAPA